jgi:hypothetical protein
VSEITGGAIVYAGWPLHHLVCGETHCWLIWESEVWWFWRWLVKPWIRVWVLSLSGERRGLSSHSVSVYYSVSHYRVCVSVWCDYS